jgi:protein-disulfide isomerase
MHDRLLQHQDKLGPKDLRHHAEQLGLDVARFLDDLREHATADRVAADVESADLSGVAGTPTFFLNGHRHLGAYDLESLTRAVDAARAMAAVPAPAGRVS